MWLLMSTVLMLVACTCVADVMMNASAVVVKRFHHYTLSLKNDTFGLLQFCHA